MLKTALKFLWYDKSKSMGALMGIVISTFLIGQQAGVFSFIMHAMSLLASLNPEYVWVVDSKTTNVNALGKLDMRIQRQITAFDGVEKVYSIVATGANVQYPEGDNTPIQLIGLETPDFVGGPKPQQLIDGKLTDLLPEGAVCVDLFDTRVFKKTNIGTSFEINGHKAYAAARTSGLRGFAANAVLYTTIERARAWTRMPITQANAFLVKVKNGVNKDEMCKRINNNIFGVRAWKGNDFANETISTLLRTTPIGFAFGALVLFAFIAGFFIVGLTLYSAAVDRLKDYGTMKAIGATNAYIRKLIYSQALLFSIFGFIFGFSLIQLFKIGVAKVGMTFEYHPLFIYILLLMIIAIAFGGASFASRKIAKLEPAEVFRF